MNELEFPLTCHFRVVAEKLEDMQGVIEAVLLQLGVTDAVEEANTSKGGTYVSYNITTVVESREAMATIDQKLRAIEGVKMVL